MAVAAFLFQWRTVLVALFTIPLSLVAAALVLHLLGETFNAISFAGLAVALAVVIDEAVAGAENVAPADASSSATPAATGRPATSSGTPRTRCAARWRTRTLIALLAIVPVAVMEGRPGAFFEPLALSYALAVVTAMVVALTVTPALSMLLFSRGPAAYRESPLLGLLRPRYDSALSRIVRQAAPDHRRRGGCHSSLVGVSRSRCRTSP